MDEYTIVIYNERTPHTDADYKIYDNYLNMDFSIQGGNDYEMIFSHVNNIVVDIEGNPIGLSNKNPIIYYIQY